MKFNPELINELIRSRRSIFPSSYIDKEIPRAIIEQVLENANWAPTHKRTEPWRFKVMTGAAKSRMGEFMANWYRENTSDEKFSPIKMKKLRNNPAKAACLIAVCMKRDSKESIPEWEEISSVAMAVQNMYLTCTSYGIGSYWSSPKPSLMSADFLKLEEGERCLGLFYMGYFEGDLPEGRRESPAVEKVEWMD